MKRNQPATWNMIPNFHWSIYLFWSFWWSGSRLKRVCSLIMSAGGAQTFRQTLQSVDQHNDNIQMQKIRGIKSFLIADVKTEVNRQFCCKFDGSIVKLRGGVRLSQWPITAPTKRKPALCCQTYRNCSILYANDKQVLIIKKDSFTHLANVNVSSKSWLRLSAAMAWQPK